MPEGATATDLVLTVTQMLRKHGVVGKFVEFFGDGLKHLALADRATIANMAPEYGATAVFSRSMRKRSIICGCPGAKNRTSSSSRNTRRHRVCGTTEHTARGIQFEAGTESAEVKPSLAGPKRPQDRVLLEDVAKSYEESFKR